MKLKRFAVSTLVLVGTVLTTSCVRTPTITFWNGFGADMDNHLQSALGRDWLTPDGYKVGISTKGGYDNLYSAIMDLLSSKGYPNIALAYPDHMANYIMNNMMQPLDPLIDQYASDPENFFDQFDAKYMEENTSLGVYGPGFPDRVGQKVTYGIPFNKSTEVFTVNQSFFDYAVTVDDTITRVPETWTELATVGAKINDIVLGNKAVTGGLVGKAVALNGSTYTIGTDKDAAGVVLDFTNTEKDKFRPFGYDSYANLFITLLYQFGAKYTTQGTKDASRTDPTQVPDVASGSLNFLDVGVYDKTVEAMSVITQLIKDNIVGLSTGTWESANGYCSDAFKKLNLVGTVGSSAGVTNNVLTKGKTKSYPIPYNGNSATGKQVISQGTNIVIFNSPKQELVKASVEAVERLTTTVNLDFAIKSGYFPVRPVDLKSEEYQSYLEDTNLTTVEASRVSAAQVNFESYKADDSEWSGFVDPGFAGSAAIRLMLSKTVGAIYDTAASFQPANAKAFFATAFKKTILNGELKRFIDTSKLDPAVK